MFGRKNHSYRRLSFQGLEDRQLMTANVVAAPIVAEKATAVVVGRSSRPLSRLSSWRPFRLRRSSWPLCRERLPRCQPFSPAAC